MRPHFRQFKIMKDAVYIRAKVVGKANSNISINKVNLPKLLVEPVDLMAIKTTGDYSVQFASGPLIPEVAKLYEDGMEVPLWVDTKNLKQHWVGVPSF